MKWQLNEAFGSPSSLRERGRGWGISEVNFTLTVVLILLLEQNRITQLLGWWVWKELWAGNCFRNGFPAEASRCLSCSLYTRGCRQPERRAGWHGGTGLQHHGQRRRRRASGSCDRRNRGDAARRDVTGHEVTATVYRLSAEGMTAQTRKPLVLIWL